MGFFRNLFAKNRGKYSDQPATSTSEGATGDSKHGSVRVMDLKTAVNNYKKRVDNEEKITAGILEQLQGNTEKAVCLALDMFREQPEHIGLAEWVRGNDDLLGAIFDFGQRDAVNDPRLAEECFSMYLKFASRKDQLSAGHFMRGLCKIKNNNPLAGEMDVSEAIRLDPSNQHAKQFLSEFQNEVQKNIRAQMDAHVQSIVKNRLR